MIPGRTPNRLNVLIPLILCLFPLAATATDPVSVHRAEFARELEVSGRSLELKGTGLARVGGLLKICAAGLYAPKEREAGSLLESPLPPKRLEIEYFVGVRADRFTRLALKTLRRQSSPGEMESRQEALEALHALYRDVRPGDRYALTWSPGAGLTLELNGEELGRIEADEGFASFYFSIWLGEDPLSPSLKREMLASAR